MPPTHRMLSWKTVIRAIQPFKYEYEHKKVSLSFVYSWELLVLPGELWSVEEPHLGCCALWPDPKQFGLPAETHTQTQTVRRVKT